MTDNEKDYLHSVAQQEAERIIQRFKDSPNVLLAVSVKLRQAYDQAKHKQDSTTRFEIVDPSSNQGWGG